MVRKVIIMTDLACETYEMLSNIIAELKKLRSDINYMESEQDDLDNIRVIGYIIDDLKDVAAYISEFTEGEK